MTTQLIDMFRTGGIFMWPILALSIVGLAIILARIVGSVIFHAQTKQFMLFLSSKGAGGRSLLDVEGPELFRLPVAEMETLVEQELQLAFDSKLKNLEYLSAIGSLAPLLGFIGTVSGMISSFQAIATANKVSVRLVAGGISEALITTGFGLIVAVIVVAGEHVFRYYLSSRANTLTGEFTRLTRDIRLSPPAQPEPSGD